MGLAGSGAFIWTVLLVLWLQLRAQQPPLQAALLRVVVPQFALRLLLLALQQAFLCYSWPSAQQLAQQLALLMLLHLFFAARLSPPRSSSALTPVLGLSARHY